MKPRIFISHSAKEPFTQMVLEQLYEALRQDYEVLLDGKRLAAGDEWRHEIKTWLGMCHAAIILFSESVFPSQDQQTKGSPWVLFEASILTWRKDVNPNFLVIPVRLPGVSRASLDTEPFNPLAVNEIQAIKGESEEEIVDRIVQRLADAQGMFLNSLTPLSAQETFVRDVLRRFHPDVLVSAVQSILPGLTDQPLPGEDQLPLIRQVDARYRVLGAFEAIAAYTPGSQGLDPASLLASALFLADPDTCADILSQILVYTGPDNQAKLYLVEILTQTWIDPAKAACLRRALTLPAGERIFTLQGKRMKYTPKAYVGRGLASNPPWDVYPLTQLLPSGEDQGGALLGQVEALLREKLKIDEEDDINDQYVGLGLYEKRRRPVFIVLPGQSTLSDLGKVTAADLARLKQKFPTVVFFVIFNQEPQEELFLPQPGIHAVKPLDPEVEDRAYGQYNLLLRNLT